MFHFRWMSHFNLPPPVQVNFYTDHTKIILSKSLDSYLLTYISRERVSYTYPFSTLSEMGCTAELRHRLRYVLHLLQHHADAWRGWRRRKKKKKKKRLANCDFRGSMTGSSLIGWLFCGAVTGLLDPCGLVPSWLMMRYSCHFDQMTRLPPGFVPVQSLFGDI